MIKLGTAIYTRVSTNKQEKEGVSLETQLDKLHAYCTLKDLDNAKEYMDVGTGRNIERKGFKQMMKDVKSGRIKNIIVFRLDRLTRSVSDLNMLLKKLEEYGCGLHSATESLDTSTANGRLMVNLIGVLAQWESETISERVIVNMDEIASRGIWQSKAPYGFYIGDDRKLKLKEDEASLLREAFDLIFDGESLTSARRIMIQRHNVNWSTNFLRMKIRHTTTVGDIKRRDKVHENTHEGIIDKITQRKLLDIIEGNKTGRKFSEQDDLFRRRIKCPNCGYFLSLIADSRSKNKDSMYRYSCSNCYKNTGKLFSVGEKQVEEAFKKYLSDLQITEFSLQEEEEKDVSGLRNQLKNIDAKIDKLQRNWLSDLISDDDLVKYKKELDVEKESIEEKLSVIPFETPPEEILTLKEYFDTLYIDLTRDEKRRFIQRHIKNVEVNRNKVEGMKRKYDVNVTAIAFL